jgi:uncharacterized BrkB/YihY/UPF0761 family membrane protein
MTSLPPTGEETVVTARTAALTVLGTIVSLVLMIVGVMLIQDQIEEYFVYVWPIHENRLAWGVLLTLLGVASLITTWVSFCFSVISRKRE